MVQRQYHDDGCSGCRVWISGPRGDVVHVLDPEAASTPNDYSEAPTFWYQNGARTVVYYSAPGVVYRRHSLDPAPSPAPPVPTRAPIAMATPRGAILMFGMVPFGATRAEVLALHGRLPDKQVEGAMFYIPGPAYFDSEVQFTIYFVSATAGLVMGEYRIIWRGSVGCATEFDRLSGRIEATYPTLRRQSDASARVRGVATTDARFCAALEAGDAATRRREWRDAAGNAIGLEYGEQGGPALMARYAQASVVRRSDAMRR